MLRPITTSSASASSAPVAVRAGAAADFVASEARTSAIAASESAQSQVGAIKADEMFRYNSYQFVYRQDVGRIVLIGQSPETGERVIQVPSEQVLRAYARTARIERQVASTPTGRAPAADSSSAFSAQLAKAMIATVSGDNHGSGVISVSA